MFERLKIFLSFALLGFFAGVGTYYAYKQIFSSMMKYSPFLLSSEWFISGLIGSLFTLVIISLWAYTSK